MKFSKELKRIARENLIGKYRIAMGALLITFLIPLIIEFPFSNLVSSDSPSPIQKGVYFVVEILIALISGVLSIGINYIHLNISRKKDISFGDVFVCFKSQTDRYIIGYAIYLLICVIAAIPGLAALYFARRSSDINTSILCIALNIISLLLEIIVSIVYGLLFYVMIDNQDLPVIKCFSTARSLIKHKKGKLFYIILSFIGLELLGILSFGIGLLWVEPYKQQTITSFYRSACGELFDAYS